MSLFIEEGYPLFHIVAGNEKWNVCLSRLGKQLAGAAVVLIVALLSSAFGFAWQSNRALGEIARDISSLDRRATAIEQSVKDISVNSYSARDGQENRDRIRRLEGRAR